MRGGAACLAGLALFLSACVTPVEAAPPEAPAEATPEATMPDKDGDKVFRTEQDGLDRIDDTCGLEALKSYLGKPAADLPEGLLKTRDRILAPDSMATMDYSPERLNVLTNEAGIIIGLKCG